MCFALPEQHMWAAVKAGTGNGWGSLDGSPGVRAFEQRERERKPWKKQRQRVERILKLSVTIMFLDWLFLSLWPQQPGRWGGCLKGWNPTGPGACHPDSTHAHAQDLGPLQMVVCDHLLMRKFRELLPAAARLLRRPPTTPTHTCATISNLGNMAWGVFFSFLYVGGI